MVGTSWSRHPHLPPELFPDDGDSMRQRGQAMIEIEDILAKLSPDDLSELHELLGKPLILGKRLLRLSSADPATNKAILHDATHGERTATPLDEFLKLFRKIGMESEEPFPEGVVMSQPGTRADAGKLGPKGGIAPAKRKIPKTATR